MTLISIVVPVFNEEVLLGNCLEAIFGQDEPAHEVIVVDNGSDDGTLAVLAGYQGRLILLHEPRPGVHHARSRGLDAATGDVIGRIDADTRLAPGWTRAVRETFTGPVVQAATGPVRYYDIAASRLVDSGDALFRQASSRRSLDWLLGANMAVRAAAWHWIRDGLCTDAEVHEDIDLGIHLHREGLTVVFAGAMRAGTSARRIANRFRDYRAYALLTEKTYQRHGYAYRRAWIVTRLQLLLFPLLRLVYALAQPRPWTALRGDGGRVSAMRPRRSS
ncbi:glycosyltransferase [Actinoplanes couchii]|uniref:Glycosyl transferase n=1 Tax=Actinoplanes couchii TaxID=403638 RepID=A0ABQ3X8C5_9ACTN|nr:glycosyltransferase family 2 protein [Actinoplanes couchii]MDR6320276.1 glycosyltransferase involved in cell wall biosynthesis [Actinoplanes couchii]GID54709.1 glycosyl transferase [Actinoplanes couchii]